MTRTATTTRKAHDLKGGDTAKIDGIWRQVADAYPNSGNTFVIAYWMGYDVRRHLVPTDADIETIS